MAPATAAPPASPPTKKELSWANSQKAPAWDLLAGRLFPALCSPGRTGRLRTTTLGKVLVDARGRTLYLFEKDKRGMSACYGGCATYWPPLLSSAKPRPGSGVRASLLGVTRRKDGKRQATYAGHPLYAFVSDTKVGQTTGEGLKSFGAAWDVVAPSGRAVEPPASLWRFRRDGRLRRLRRLRHAERASVGRASCPPQTLYSEARPQSTVRTLRTVCNLRVRLRGCRRQVLGTKWCAGLADFA